MGGGRKRFLPECLERDDDMRDVELRLEVELDGGVLLPVAGLPPGHPLVSPKHKKFFFSHLDLYLRVYCYRIKKTYKK